MGNPFPPLRQAHLKFADGSGFCGRRSFSGSKKGKKGAKEQKGIFLLFLHLFCPFAS